jgi:hypothetical protein
MDVNDPERYIDLVKHFESQRSYQDFEGFADSRRIQRRWDKAMFDRPDINPVAKTLVFHWMFGMLDTADILASVRDVQMAYECMENALGSRWFLKETAT